MVALPVRPPSPSKLSTLALATLIVPLSTSPPALTRSSAKAVAMSRLPLSVAPVRKLAALPVAAKRPLPLVLMVPASVTPFCSTVLPVPATIWPKVPPVTLLLNSKVPPFNALSVPLLVTTDSVMLMVPPTTSALMVPLLTSTCVPPMLIWLPMVPLWPRTVTPAAKVVVPLPSK